jgi:zinc transport system ATP-binding protein
MNEYAVETDNLTVKFGEHYALEGLHVKAPLNSFIAVVGPNGAGKSTFFKVLLGLIKPTAGEVKLFGLKPSEVQSRSIGYVPQVKTMDRSFPALSLELVITGISRKWPWRRKKSLRDEAIHALEQVGAGHLAQRPISKLSGGELQRVCLARSIARKPAIVMLDEPATGIDAVGEADMYQLLDSYRKENSATIMMITHDWQAAVCHTDYVLLMNQKQISFDRPEQALSEENLRTAFGHIGHHHHLHFLGDAHV